MASKQDDAERAVYYRYVQNNTTIWFVYGSDSMLHSDLDTLSTNIGLYEEWI
jgi:hypothetical protein